MRDLTIHFCMPDKNAAEKAQALLDKAMSENNSVGGIVECVVTGMPAGVGEPVLINLMPLLQRLFYQ